MLTPSAQCALGDQCGGTRLRGRSLFRPTYAVMLLTASHTEIARFFARTA